MKLNETPALPMAPESAYDRALQRALTDILRPLLRKVNALDTSALLRKVNALDTSGGGYVAPSMLNGWVNFGEGYNPAGYMLDGLGFVHLRGLIKLGVMHSPAFQLPPGFRPAYDEYMATIAGNAFASVTTTSAGDVIPWDGVNTWLSLDGITFKALDTSGGGYVAPSMLNGWVNFGEGYNPAGYMLDGLGFVHLRGLIKLGVMHSPAFQLPPGFRPAYDEYMATIAGNAFASVNTTSAGDVIPWDGVNRWVSLDGITFKAAQ